MRLLIVTQAVDREHSNLGFFHALIEEFAKSCESVQVICLQEGAHDLPANVSVHSLGKEKGASRIAYLLRFYTHIWTLRNGYDAVFVHMNPEYIVLGGLFWRAWHKKIGLWYVHKSVTLRLRIAIVFADLVFTVAPESFPLKTPKLRLVGHGIDTELFKPAAVPSVSRSGVLRIVTVGRISRSKGIDTMIAALDVLEKRGVSFTFSIIGAPITAQDRSYDEDLRRLIASKPYASAISMMGAKSNRDLPAALRDADVFVNVSATGGYDKAVLEALALGVPALSSSPSFRSLLAPYNLFVADTAPELLATAIERSASIDTAPLRSEIIANHSLIRLIPAIMAAYVRD